MGVFALLSVLIVAIHQQVSLLQRRTQGEQKVTSDARFALEAMATALRVGTVYYAGYAKENATYFNGVKCEIKAPAPGSVLYLIDEDNERVRYAYENPCSLGARNGCIVKNFFGTEGNPSSPIPSARVTADDLDVLSLGVQIQPLCSPYNPTCVSTGSNIRQPFVTLSIGARVPKQAGARTETIQTSISSRVYQNITDVCTPLP